MSTPSFRDYLFAPDHPRVAEIRGLDAREYAEAAKSDSFAGPMIEGWQKLYPQPFTGITSDGVRREGLYPLAPARPGEEAPTAEMVAAARKLLGTLDARHSPEAELCRGRPRMAELGQPGVHAARHGSPARRTRARGARRRAWSGGGEPERRRV